MDRYAYQLTPSCEKKNEQKCKMNLDFLTLCPYSFAASFLYCFSSPFELQAFAQNDCRKIENNRVVTSAYSTY